MKIRSNDYVEVTSGVHKGQRGRVLRVLPKRERAVVEGVNYVFKHVRSNPQQDRKGGILKTEASLHVSRLVLVNRQTDQKGGRVGFRNIDGKKQRYFKSNGTAVDE